MTDFCQFLIFFMEFINIGLPYIRGWVGGHRNGVGDGKNLKKKQDDTIVEFRVVIMYICTYKGPIFH